MVPMALDCAVSVMVLVDFDGYASYVVPTDLMLGVLGVVPFDTIATLVGVLIAGMLLCVSLSVRLSEKEREGVIERTYSLFRMKKESRAREGNRKTTNFDSKKQYEYILMKKEADVIINHMMNTSRIA